MPCSVDVRGRPALFWEELGELDMNGKEGRLGGDWKEWREWKMYYMREEYIPLESECLFFNAVYITARGTSGFSFLISYNHESWYDSQELIGSGRYTSDDCEAPTY